MVARFTRLDAAWPEEEAHRHGGQAAWRKEMKVRATLLVLVGCLAMAGCGGGSSTPARTGDQIFACMKKTFPFGVSDNEDDLDFIAQAAGDKGISIEWPKNELNIAVERSESDAKNTLRAYRLFISESGKNQLTRIANAVAAYSKTPTSDEFDPVKACLGSD